MDYDCICRVRGVKLDTRMVVKSLAMISNTDERATELISELDQVLSEGRLSRKDGERPSAVCQLPTLRTNSEEPSQKVE